MVGPSAFSASNHAYYLVHRFCVDSDVSRIEEADKRTFETIAQFSHNGKDS